MRVNKQYNTTIQYNDMHFFLCNDMRFFLSVYIQKINSLYAINRIISPCYSTFFIEKSRPWSLELAGIFSIEIVLHIEMGYITGLTQKPAEILSINSCYADHFHHKHNFFNYNKCQKSELLLISYTQQLFSFQRV